MEDLDLVEQFRAGSLEAFTELVRHHQHRVRGFIAGMVGNRADVVDDIAQEAFLAAYRSIDTYQPARVPFGAWLAGIARHRALTFLRDERRRRHRERDQLDEVIAVGRLADAEEDGGDRRMTALDACLEELPPKARSLINARYQTDTSISDLAQRSGRAETAVRMALSRVRAVLRRCIEQRAMA
jgi:RNA polymerase sigma-70 factor, ECF subfamily